MLVRLRPWISEWLALTGLIADEEGHRLHHGSLGGENAASPPAHRAALGHFLDLDA